MSENYQRQEVKSVSCSALPVAAGGIIVAAGLVAIVLNALSSVAKEAYRAGTAKTPPTDLPKTIKSLGAIKCDTRPIQGGSCILNQVEGIKVSTLLQLSNSQYIVDNSTPIYQKMEALRSASTPVEARNAQASLINEVESSHQKLFVKGLTLACEKASLKAGFLSVNTTASNGLVRVVATDSLGRALVSEINAKSQEPRLVSETVGINDGSCKKIIDVFDKALEEQGVKSAPPRRKFTGGVCELEAVKEFLHRHMMPGKSNRENGIKRSQRLNNQKKQLRQRV